MIGNIEESEYEITCLTENDVFDIANLLYDTNHVIYSTPDFHSTLSLNTSDYYYANQWGLDNSGQEDGVASVDIKAELAWDFLEYYRGDLGDSIRIAVIDVGVADHEDLKDANGNSRVIGGFPNNGNGAPISNEQKHGTCCAGIIAASHNNIGIAGIAPNSLIVPMRISRDAESITFSCSRIARAIKLSWRQYGASVLSISWGIQPNDIVTNAFQNAMNNGRNGKGCAVVVASGNNNEPSVEYPANINGVISVGAVDRCGKRSGGL